MGKGAGLEPHPMVLRITTYSVLREHSWWNLGGLYSVGDRTQVNCTQNRCPIYCSVTLTPEVFVKIMKNNFILNK